MPAPIPHARRQLLPIETSATTTQRHTDHGSRRRRSYGTPGVQATLRACWALTDAGCVQEPSVAPQLGPRHPAANLQRQRAPARRGHERQACQRAREQALRGCPHHQRALPSTLVWTCVYRESELVEQRRLLRAFIAGSRVFRRLRQDGDLVRARVGRHRRFR